MKKIVFIMTIGLFFSFFKSPIAQENKFTKDDIKSAQKIIGMEFNDSEIDSLQEKLNELLKDYNKIWSAGLNNSIPPALGFNPIPVGFKSPNKSDKFEVSDYSNTKMPENKADLAYYSIGQLAELIRTKKITSVELTRFFLERLKKYNPKLECVISLTEELAIKQAERADTEIESWQI